MMLNQQRAAARGLLSAEQLVEYNNDATGSPRVGGGGSVMFASAPTLSPPSPGGEALVNGSGGGASGAPNGRKSLALMMGHLNKLTHGTGLKKAGGTENAKEVVRDGDGIVVEEVRFDLRTSVVPQLTLAYPSTTTSHTTSTTTVTATDSSTTTTTTTTHTSPDSSHSLNAVLHGSDTPTPGVMLSIEDGGSMAALLEQIQNIALENAPRKKTLVSDNLTTQQKEQPISLPFQKKVYKAHTTMRVVMPGLGVDGSNTDNSTPSKSKIPKETSKRGSKRGSVRGSKRNGMKGRESGDTTKEDPRRVHKTEKASGSSSSSDLSSGDVSLSPRAEVAFVPLTVELMEKEAIYDAQHPSKNRTFTFIPPFGLCEVQLRIIVVDEKKLEAAKKQAEAVQKRKEYEEKRRKKELKQMRQEDEESMQMDMMVVEVSKRGPKLNELADEADDEAEKLIVERFLAEARKRQQANKEQQDQGRSPQQEKGRSPSKEHGSVGSIAGLVGKERITKKEKSGSRIAGLDFTNIMKGPTASPPSSPMAARSDEYRKEPRPRKLSEFGLDSGDFTLEDGQRTKGSQLKKVRKKNRASAEVVGGAAGRRDKKREKKEEQKKEKKEKKENKKETRKKKDSERDRELERIKALAAAAEYNNNTTSPQRSPRDGPPSPMKGQDTPNHNNKKSQALLSFVSGSVISPRMVSLNNNKDSKDKDNKDKESKDNKDSAKPGRSSNSNKKGIDGSSSAKKKKKKSTTLGGGREAGVGGRRNTTSGSKSMIAGAVLLNPHNRAAAAGSGGKTKMSKEA